MKHSVHLVSNDIKLFNIFIESDLFSNVTIGNSFDTPSGDPLDIVVISDRIINVNSLIEFYDTGKLKANKIVYLTSNIYNAMQLNNLRIILQAKNIVCIPPKLTESQILERLCQLLNIDTNTNKNVVAFFGADSKVGCTITALSVAESLADNTECSVCFLNLQGNISYGYINESIDGKGMDSIKSKIFSSVLSGPELKSSMTERDKLYILPGINTLTDFRYYHPKHAEFLINLASELFDIVIVDAGSNPSSGLYIGSLNCTANRYMVATQQESCRKAFLAVNEQLLKVLSIDTESFILVINRYNGLLEYMQTYKLAQTNFGMSNVVILPNVNGVYWQTEIDCKSLRHYNDLEYNKRLHELNKIIAGQLGVEYKDLYEIKRKSRRFFRLK